MVEVTAADERGIGYTYSTTATASLIRSQLTDVVVGREAMDVVGAWDAMIRSVRNLGRPRIASAAISAVDAALWDLKARLLGVPLSSLLGSIRRGVEVYGSGGFTSYSNETLREQFSAWAAEGIRAFKMKIGREPHKDRERVRSAREAIGWDSRLFVDANGAHAPREALAQAAHLAEQGVVWFEEPVSSDDLAGMRLVRERCPHTMAVVAGKYCYDVRYFRAMLETRAVDILQADVTRCGGITGFMAAGALCEAFSLPLSAHTATLLHVHVCCSLPKVRDLEYFHDHVRIERLFFDSAAKLVNGILCPDFSQAGTGIELRRADMARYAA